MIRLSEWVKSNNLFQMMIDQNDDTVFLEECGAVALNTALIVSYGSRYVPNTLIEMPLEEVADYIFFKFGELWKHNFEALLKLEYGIEYKTSTDTDTKENIAHNVKTNSVNQSSAFNVDESTETGRNDDQTSDELARDNGTKMIVKKESFDTLGKQLTFARKNLLSNSICIDVSNVVTLSVY